MIEMRWLKVPAGSNRGLYGTGGGEIWEMVLQYRYRETNPLSMLPTPWSEWYDVPLPNDTGERR